MAFAAAATVRVAPSDDLRTTTTAADRFVRAEHLDAGYSPWRHVALTLGIAAAIAALAVALAWHARPLDWLLMPAFFVVANFLEWAVHRYPMHRPRVPLFMYKNHAQLHHVAFTNQNMPVATVRELGLVMMPWYTMIGLFVVASPVMIAAAVVRGPGLAGVFLLAAVLYFLGYETLHALYHFAGCDARPGGPRAAARVSAQAGPSLAPSRPAAHVGRELQRDRAFDGLGVRHRREAGRAREVARPRGHAAGASLLHFGRELLGLSLVADLRRGVDAHEVSARWQPQARRRR